MFVVDIGANIGYYSLMAAQLVGEEGRVFAFEPDPKNFELLSRNLELNGYRNVVAVQKAVSNTSGIVTLYIDETNFGNRSFGEKNIVNDGGAVETQTVSFDEFYESEMHGARIDVLKIDAQGAEGLIFEGARKTLTNQTPRIFMEFEPDMLLNLGTNPIGLLLQFANVGYNIKLIDYVTKMLRPVSNDDLLELCSKYGYVDLFMEKDPQSSTLSDPLPSDRLS
jgi:FkbM family methyltransferase